MKTNKEILDSLLKTVQMGQCGIRCVQDSAEGAELRQALTDQLGEYDNIERDAYALASNRGWELEPLNQVRRTVRSQKCWSRATPGA